MKIVGASLAEKCLKYAQACGKKSILQTKPLQQSVPNVLARDVIQIDRVGIFRNKLENVLRSEYCEMPNYLSLIPKRATKEETVQILKQLFEDSKFFSRVSTCEHMYGKNFEFAQNMSSLSKQITKSISEGNSFENVIEQISSQYSRHSTRGSSVVYRGNNNPPETWPTIYGEDMRLDCMSTKYGDSWFGAYKEYEERLDKYLGNRVSPLKNFTITRAGRKVETLDICDQLMVHPYPEEVLKNMKIISKRYKIYQNLVNEYTKKGYLTTGMKKQVDDIISEIYYLMANTCPFERGSNGISDVLMRSQYSALGINKPHVKKGTGLDLEAFCLNLDEYKTRWDSFFE